MICIIDYGVGNYAAIGNMLRRIGVESCISRDPTVISAAKKLVLPGVGAFDEGMRNLRNSGLIELLNELVVIRHVPILGICLGMQLLGLSSEEGNESGLEWIPMRFKRFEPTKEGRRVKSLHMGWNIVTPLRRSQLFGGFEHPPRFYFVHRYFAVCEEPTDILGMSTYGVEFASAVARENIFGVQFHPEKSHRFGMRLLQNFAEGS